METSRNESSDKGEVRLDQSFAQSQRGDFCLRRIFQRMMAIGAHFHFIRMFVFSVDRPPNGLMKKAYRLIKNCDAYIFFSTDSTVIYLDESLKLLESNAPILRATEGNTTSSSDYFYEMERFYSVIAIAIRWVRANRNFSPEELKIQHPNLIADGQQEAKQESRSWLNWTYSQADREIPNLLSSFIHRDRLGDVIDEVLGLSGFRQRMKCCLVS
jgi:hypothetical protein